MKTLPGRIKVPIVVQELAIYEDGSVEMPKPSNLVTYLSIDFGIGVMAGTIMTECMCI